MTIGMALSMAKETLAQRRHRDNDYDHWNDIQYSLGDTSTKAPWENDYGHCNDIYSG